MRFWMSALTFAFAVLFFDHYAIAANCTAEQREAGNRALNITDAQRASSISAHLPFGVPQNTRDAENERVLVQRDYVINYDDDLRVPIWTAHRLTKSKLGKAARTDCFRSDPRIPEYAASRPSDYEEPIYDQGHLTPNSDMSVSEVAVINSFLMSNMTPQYCQFNRGVWQIFESVIRLWAQDHKELYVLTGSVFDRDNNKERDGDASAQLMKSKNGKQRVAVPSHHFKVLYYIGANGSAHALSVLLPHDQTDLTAAPALSYLEAHVVKLVDLEKLTNLKLLPSSATVVEAATLWPINGTPNGTLVDDRCRKTAG